MNHQTNGESSDHLWEQLASLQADRWERIKATMQMSGFDVEKGACLLVPTSYILIDPPDWVFPVTDPNITVPSMSQARPEKKRLLFWWCPVRCGGTVAWDKTVGPPVAHCKCGLTSSPAVPTEEEITARALAALDAMATTWAASFDLRSAVRAMLKTPDAENRLVDFIKQAHVEGLYTGRTSKQEG